MLDHQHRPNFENSSNPAEKLGETDRLLWLQVQATVEMVARDKIAVESQFSDFDVILGDFKNANTSEERELQLDALVEILKLLDNSTERLTESRSSLEALAYNLRRKS
jgi:hypothetical protein